MSLYVQLPNDKRDAWIEEHCKEVTVEEAAEHDVFFDRENVLLMVADHGEKERQMFKSIEILNEIFARDTAIKYPDKRPRKYYIVSVDDLSEGAGFSAEFPDMYRKNQENIYSL